MVHLGVQEWRGLCSTANMHRKHSAVQEHYLYAFSNWLVNTAWTAKKTVHCTSCTVVIDDDVNDDQNCSQLAPLAYQPLKGVVWIHLVAVHLTPRNTGQPVCVEALSILPSGFREKNSRASRCKHPQENTIKVPGS